MSEAFAKELPRAIKSSLGRFLAIAGIVALGCGFYAGLGMSGRDMRLAADAFYDGCQLFDIRVVSTLGLSDKQLEEIRSIEGVEQASGLYALDAMVSVGDEQNTMRISSIKLPDVQGSQCDEEGVVVDSTNKAYLNRLVLAEGRWPKKADECLASADRTSGLVASLGDKVDVLSGSASLDGVLEERSYTVVGLVHAPAFVSNTTLGYTSLGSGLIQQYLYVPEEAFAADLPFTEVNLTVQGAAAELSLSDAYWTVVDEVYARLDANSDQIAQSRLDELRSDAQSELDEATQEYEDGKQEAEDEIAKAQAELDDALSELDAAREKIRQGEADLASGRAKLAEARSQADAQFAAAKKKLDDAEAEISKQEAELEAAQKKVDEGRASVGMSQEELESARSQAQAAVNQAQTALEEIAAGKAQAQAAQEQLEGALAQLSKDDPSREGLETQLAEVQAQLQAFDAAETEAQQGLQTAQEGLAQAEVGLSALDELDTAQKEIDEGRTKLKQGKKQLEQGRASYNSERSVAYSKISAAEQELVAAASELESGKLELASGQERYNEGREEFERNKAKVDRDLADAATQLAKAQVEIDELEAPDVYILDRSTNLGVTSYQDDSERIDHIAAVFPLIFFLVAALVALTTMTRMVEEERVEIGTHKALGFSTWRITSKYLLYAALAGVTGALVGIVLMSQVLPRVIMVAYAIMYSVPIPAVALPIDIPLSALSIAAGVGITLLATWAAAAATLREVPATLMLPRAPAAGKRILLEHIGPIWRRMSFSWKVSARNLFRYKRRLAMTMVGIAGCTALLLTGLGLHDAIWDIISKQFEGANPIVSYSVLVGFDEQATLDENHEAIQILQTTGEAKHIAFVDSENMQVSSSTMSEPMAIQLMVTLDEQAFCELVDLRERVGATPIVMDSNSVVLSEKTATMLGLGVGDTVDLYEQDDIGNASGEPIKLTVTAITENYVRHYCYVGQEAWSLASGDAATANTLLADVGTEDTQRAKITDALHELDDVSTVMFFSEIIESYRKSLSSVNMVVVVLVVAAAALAFIVLYNLTNINIVERIREIASLKVLGFTRAEVAAYVFREILLLILMGAAIGLGLGTLLEHFVVLSSEVDVVMFGREIHPMSYLLSYALTLVFAAFVMLSMLPKLRRISMVESLKSVD